MNNKVSILLLDIGNFKAFSLQTYQEWVDKVAPKEVFWKYKPTDEIFGPFSSIYEACNHFTVIDKERKERSAQNIIYINFRTKKILSK